MQHYLTVEGVRKRFGNVEALAGVDFYVDEGEFFTLLGPSGCGKTTLLRCIAGFERLDGGQITIASRDVSSMLPEQRDCGFVFQRYALFPTMTVAENVGFGLEMRKVTEAERERRVADVLTLVGLEGMDRRKPNQLSGGQQQRVALARALVIRPRMLLLDEPLSNLDANLRIEMRTEVRRLQREVGITTLYVTHDQEEAFSLSDRVLVLSDGREQQTGTPHELYFQPRNAFVADFIGQANVLEGRCIGCGDGSIAVETGGSRLDIPTNRPIAPGNRVALSVRPERIEVTETIDGQGLAGTVRRVEFLGSAVRFHVDCGADDVLAEVTGLSRAAIATLPIEGTRVQLSFTPEDCTLLDTADRGT